MSRHHWEIINSGSIVVSSTPKGLWDNACKYFQWVDDNPILKSSVIKNGQKVGTQVVDELPRAYHIKALCLHCGIEEEWLKDIRNTKDKESEYYQVVSRILYVIYSQQYELASVGELNPIFTAKALNMDVEEKSNQAIRIEHMGSVPALSRSENEVLEKLELEIELNGNPAFKKS